MVLCRKLSCKNLKFIGKQQNRGHTRAKRHVWFAVRVAYGTFARRHLSVYNDRKPLDNFKLPYKRKLLLHSLVELRNALIREGRNTDFVDEVILKVADASLKKGKTV